MNFVYIEFLWLILPLILLFIFIKKGDRLSKIFSKEILHKLNSNENAISPKIRNILLITSIFLMIIALSRPVKEIGDKNVEIEGLTILTALDISGSMRSTDVYPNRLTFAKTKIKQLFDLLPNDNIGVEAFAYSSFVVAPFSSDKETLKIMLDGVNESYINMGSTDFDALAEVSANLLEKQKPKILIVFSDGGDKKALQNFKESIKDNDIKLFVVLIGTVQGSPVLTKENKPYKLEDGSIAITQRNNELGEIAKELGGAFVVASNGKDDIKNIVSIIKSNYKSQNQGAIKVKQRLEYFYYPLALSILFLLLSFISLPTRKNI
jgi:Ca-activated chloride channel family protein